MELIEDKDILSAFYLGICSYFSGKCSNGKCSFVKKHKEHLQNDGDFSIPLNTKAHEKHSETCFSEEDYSNWCQLKSENSRAKKLVDSSDKWPLKISQCEVRKERLCLYLNKKHTFETVLQCILAHGPLYGKTCTNNFKKVLLLGENIGEDEWAMNMTDYRKNLVRCVLKNLLSLSGHLIIEDSTNGIAFDNNVHYYVSSNPSYLRSDKVFIHCAAVIDLQKKCKVKDIIAKDYLRHRCETLKEMSRHKYGKQVENDANWEKFFRTIGEATLRIEMLSVRPSRSINVDFHGDCQETSRNAHFILYNCARLAALQEKFEKECSERIYPPLVPLEEIDFSLLVKEEEWELLLNYLLMYPHVLQNTIELLDKGRPMPNLLCQFLSCLCGCFSGYYRRVRVLTEPRDHMLPVMYARLYLLKAVQHVLHNGLRVLGIEPIRYM